jgi:hypothetical protein
MSLGMTLIRPNKICFGNMNLVFGSEVALLGFWEYMFQILFRVRKYLSAWARDKKFRQKRGAFSFPELQFFRGEFHFV